MRLFPLVAVALSLVLAGCAKTDEPPADSTTPTSTTPTMTTPTGTTPTGTTPTGTTPPTNTTPTMVAPKELCSVPYDFSTPPPADPAAAQAPVVKACGEATTGYKAISANVTWTMGAPPAYVGTDATVKLVASDKSAVGTCKGPAAGAMEAPKACLITGVPVAGAYTLQFEGHGSVSAKVVVTLS